MHVRRGRGVHEQPAVDFQQRVGVRLHGVPPPTYVRKQLGDAVLGQAALQYGSTAGDDRLRKLTAKRIRQLDGTPRGQAASYEAKRTVVTHGSQQFLYMVTEVLCDSGDIVLVEDPTYFVYLGIMQSRGVAGRGVRMNRDGIDLAHLEQLLESLRRSGELNRLKMLDLVS